MSIKEEHNRQKSRVDWLSDGDKKSKFSYAATKYRYSQNYLTQIISTDGSSLDSSAKIKVLAPKYYEKLFHQSYHQNIFLQLILKKKLTFKVAEWLIRKLSCNKIEKALFRIGVIRPRAQMVIMQGFSQVIEMLFARTLLRTSSQSLSLKIRVPSFREDCLQIHLYQYMSWFMTFLNLLEAAFASNCICERCLVASTVNFF